MIQALARWLSARTLRKAFAEIEAGSAASALAKHGAHLRRQAEREKRATMTAAVASGGLVERPAGSVLDRDVRGRA